MISFWRIFLLELISLMRSHTIILLTAAGVAWMFIFPNVMHDDFTDAGARELYIHFSLGGVFFILIISLLASATASIAKERDEKRLQLTLVRPVSRCAIALGKIYAHVFVGAVILALASGILLFNVSISQPCNHVLSPILPSPKEEAKIMYERFMADTNTPVEVRKANKASVLRLLENKAYDHYEAIPTNRLAKWRFAMPERLSDGERLAVQLRLTNAMDLRMSIYGHFSIGDYSGAVSNLTQAVLRIPLVGEGKVLGNELSFLNKGSSSVMLRPRRDIKLLVSADGFGWNLFRAYFQLLSILTLVVAIGVLLSSALSRPVAMFVAMVMLLISEISPSIIEQYSDELDAPTLDRIGLEITRVSAMVTSPISSLSPLEALAKDECVESSQTLRIVVLDFALMPFLLALLSAFIMAKKQ